MQSWRLLAALWAAHMLLQLVRCIWSQQKIIITADNKLDFPSTHSLQCIGGSDWYAVTGVVIIIWADIWWFSPCTGIYSTRNTSSKVAKCSSSAE